MRSKGLFSRGPSPLVAPGTYSAQAYCSEGDSTEAIGNKIEFELESIISPTLPIPDCNEVIKQVQQMGVVANEAQLLHQQLSNRVDEVNPVIDRIRAHPRGTTKSFSQAQRLRQQPESFDRMLDGDKLPDKRWATTKPDISQRFSNSICSVTSGTYPPSTTAVKQY